ncbi:nuclear transport factor 2 family protein [Quisquiliibacterium transsilvanicum]|uniref:Nuclear transport factor 2 family protein n=1 Tax=Quisquiliibacterium transsilvanicum TaxID=1549638 RepID=A0A7W8HFP7_9BURK|nr:nuclear transport factor 2 family protein [Quisquiliibacterium transsilvanicum]MBB5271171.1 hypothetical protein [Quisquiliibacterium transsilvanicum]
MSADDRKDIERTVQAYFDGLYEGDADRLAEVFHETASLTWAQDGRLESMPLAKWLESVRARPSAKSRGLERDDAILVLDQSGPASAFVKVKCQIPPLHFTDYLNLLKVGGRWVVAQKVFATEVRKSP